MASTATESTQRFFEAFNGIDNICGATNYLIDFIEEQKLKLWLLAQELEIRLKDWVSLI